MNILFVLKKGNASSQTGEGTQARETAKALTDLGNRVTKAFVAPNPFSAEDENARPLDLEDLRELARSNDIVHLMPASRRISELWRNLECGVPVAGSTVFWSGWERLGVTRLSAPFGWARCRRMITYLRMMVPALQDFHGIDLFLPNTKAEGNRVLSCFRHDKDALCVPVPNAFIPPSFPLDGLPRPPFVPDGDYLVVPGIFALRKNQLTLIRAMKQHGIEIPVIFLGGEFNHPLDRAFHARCKKEATPNMQFVDFLPNTSEDYWSVLRYARCACLPSDCETPGIALLEAAFAGARPVLTRFGGADEYFGADGEYFHPCRPADIADALERAWRRGRLTPDESQKYLSFSWRFCAETTVEAYTRVISRRADSTVATNDSRECFERT